MVYRFRDFFTMAPEVELKEGQPLPYLYGDTLNLLDSVSAKTQLVVTIDATYSGYLLNHRVYPGKFVRDKRSWGTWISTDRGGLAPFDKPVLTHHQQSDGDPIGRITGAKFMQLLNDEQLFLTDFKHPATQYDKGSGKIVLDVAINDEDAKLKIVDGRYMTVSSGQSSPNAWCSICKHDIAKSGDMCEHYPGVSYDVPVKGKAKDETKAQVMYIITGLLDYHELSFVNIPGNAFAQVTSVSDIMKTLKQAEDDLGLDHAQSLGVGSFDRYARVALLDAEGHVTELIRPEGADDDIPYSKDNVRGASHVSLIDLEVPASTLKTDELENTGSMGNAASGGYALLNKDEPMTTKTDDKLDAQTPPAPPSKDKGKKPEDKTTDEKVHDLLTDKVDEQKERISDLQSLADTRQAQLDSRSEELASAREQLRTALAQQLAFSRVITGHLDTDGVESQEDFEALVGSYAERTIESLQDAVTDAIPAVRTKVSKMTDNQSSFLFDEKPVDTPVDTHRDKTNRGDDKQRQSEPAESDQPTREDLDNL